MLRGQTFVQPQFWFDGLQNDDLTFIDGFFLGNRDGFNYLIGSLSPTDDTLISSTAKTTDFGFESVGYLELEPLFERWVSTSEDNLAKPYYLDLPLFYAGGDLNDLIAVRPEIYAIGGFGSDTFIVRDIGQLDILDFTLGDTISFDLGVLGHLPGQQAGIDKLLPFVTGTSWNENNFTVDFGNVATLTFHDITPEIVDVGLIGLQNVEVWS